MLKQFQTVFDWIDSKLCNCVCLQSKRQERQRQNVTPWQRNHNVNVFEV